MRLGIMSMTHSVCSPSCSGRYAEPLPPHHRQLWRSPTLGRTFTRRHGRHGATTRSPIVITAAASPRRELSWQQRWRAFKFNMKEKKAQLGNVPPFAQILAAAAAVRAALQPLYDVAAALQLRWEQFNETYNQFLAEETKEKWTWAKRNRKEMAFLDAIPPYVFAFVCTLAYQAFIPVSFFCAIVLPLYYSWVTRDRWWLSPVFLGMLAMAPLKFVPWGFPYFCWIWPGLL